MPILLTHIKIPYIIVPIFIMKVKLLRCKNSNERMTRKKFQGIIVESADNFCCLLLPSPKNDNYLLYSLLHLGATSIYHSLLGWPLTCLLLEQKKLKKKKELNIFECYQCIHDRSYIHMNKQLNYEKQHGHTHMHISICTFITPWWLINERV